MMHVVINTYNRKQEVEALVKQVLEELNGRGTVSVYDDGSKHRPELPSECHYVRLRHYGKPGYWKIINRAFNDARKKQFKYFFMLPDDDVLKPGYFDKAIATWEGIKHPKKICMSTYIPPHRKGKPCWNNHKQVLHNVKGVGVWDAGYMDMRIISERKFLEALNYQVRPISRSRWANNKLLGSGVGQQIPHRLSRYKMYLLDEGLVEQREVVSQMNPEAQKLRG